MDSELALTIARVAHQCWCAHMLAEGWRPGDRYDPDAKAHDSLRPFDELSPFGQDDIVQSVQDLALEESFVESLDTVYWSRNGRLRELTEQEMRVGLAVWYPEGDTSLRGKVVSWEVENPQIGRLEGICVKWENGEVIDYAARECELAIVDQP